MKTLILLFTAFFMIQASAQDIFEDVTEEKPVCYTTNYSDEEIQQRSLQTVKDMQVTLVRFEEFNQNSLEMRVELKDSDKVFSAFFICEDEGRNCYIECDGGRIEMERTDDRHLTIRNHGIVLEGGCGDDKELRYLEPTRNGDDIFQLTQTRARFCNRIEH